MEYGFSMNSEELKIAMTLLGKQELPDILKIDEKIEISQTSIDIMIKKNYMKNNGEHWNAFVYFVFLYIFNSDCRLKITNYKDLLNVIYFKCDAIIYVLKNSKKDEYIFYLTTDIKKAIEKLSYAYNDFKEYMVKPENIQNGEIEADKDISDANGLAELVNKEFVNQIFDGSFRIGIEGFILDYIEYVSCIFQLDEGYIFATSNIGFVNYKYIDYKDFINIISEWITEAHDNCKRWG